MTTFGELDYGTIFNIVDGYHPFTYIKSQDTSGDDVGVDVEGVGIRKLGKDTIVKVHSTIFNPESLQLPVLRDMHYGRIVYIPMNKMFALVVIYDSNDDTITCLDLKTNVLAKLPASRECNILPRYLLAYTEEDSKDG